MVTPITFGSAMMQCYAVVQFVRLLPRDYEDSKCSLTCERPDHCNQMGFYAHKPHSPGSTKYYLQTTGEGNFCGEFNQLAHMQSANNDSNLQQ